MESKRLLSTKKMFTQTNYSDAYDREKLRIFQALNSQVQLMVVKLDQIVTQAEEVD